jgi:hypothetical protein
MPRRSASRPLKNLAFVIARRAKPGVAIQPFIDFILDPAVEPAREQKT